MRSPKPKHVLQNVSLCFGGSYVFTIAKIYKHVKTLTSTTHTIILWNLFYKLPNKNVECSIAHTRFIPHILNKNKMIPA